MPIIDYQLDGCVNNPAPLGQTGCADFGVIRPDITFVDDNPNLQKLRAFLVEQGWGGQLEWTMVDQRGNPVDLSTCFQNPPDAVLDPIVRVAFQEMAMLYEPKTVVAITGVVQDRATGVCRIDLPQCVADTAGIYNLDWAIEIDGRKKLINRSVLSVNGTLFGDANHGPPSIQEIRIFMRDSSFADNNLLMDVEFDATEIIFAILQPLRDWNEIPPDVGSYSSHDFPYRGQWIKAIVGYLHRIAANHYRRNELPYSAGGNSVNDKNKANPYDQTAMMYLQEWKEFVTREKVQLNMAMCYASFGSYYGGGW